jgi:hypothetical protein
VIEPELRKALAGPASLEVRSRVRRLLRKAEVERADLPANRLRALRAVEVLEHVGSPDAKRVLARLAAGAPAARLTTEASAALQRLARRRDAAH